MAKRTWVSNWFGVLVLVAACSSPRRTPHDVATPAQTSEQAPLEAAARPARPAGIELDAPQGPVPWTHLDARNSEQNFQFAIVSDNTGGSREGVFAAAVQKLNLLQPEFVVSVGDLIEGYTRDRAELTRQWDHFDALLEPLAAPFFYVPGNHDITNAVMREVWHERYGPSHYHFRYKDVLFVCLDSMDGEMHQIRQGQVDWLTQTLADNSDVSWTLLFLHSPLWDDGPGVTKPSPSALNWQKVEAALGDRPFTVFAGHHHRYIKHVRNDRKHFTLATTGGVSQLRGPRHGEFDHVTWVTMTPDGPSVVNLELGGILNEDVRTEASREFSFALTHGDSLKPAPLFFDQRFTKGTTTLRLRNPFDVPVELELSLSIPNDLEVELGDRRILVQPNAVLDLPLEVSAERRFVDDYAKIRLLWKATSGGASPISFDGETAVGVVRELRSRRVNRPLVVDGALGDWGKLEFSVRRPGQVSKQEDAYRGPADNRFEVGVRHDDEHVYVAVRVFDDSVSAKPGVPPWEQDGVEIRLDARPEPNRSHYASARDGRDVILVALSPSDDSDETWLYEAGWVQSPPGIVSRCVRDAAGFVAEVAVPRAALAKMGSSSAVRINVAVSDGDADGQSQSWWWPDWREDAHVPGTGTFEL